MTLENQIRYYRHQRGLQQDELAKLCRITTVWLSHIETGRKIPSPTIVQALVDALGLTIPQSTRLWAMVRREQNKRIQKKYKAEK